MPLTHIRCPYCNGKNVEEQSTYTIKCGAPRTMYYCSSCERSFSETSRHRCFSRHPVLDHHDRDTLWRLLPEAIHDRQRYRLTCGFPRGLKLG